MPKIFVWPLIILSVSWQDDVAQCAPYRYPQSNKWHRRLGCANAG
jgi:hypothetical protein